MNQQGHTILKYYKWSYLILPILIRFQLIPGRYLPYLLFIPLALIELILKKKFNGQLTKKDFYTLYFFLIAVPIIILLLKLFPFAPYSYPQ